MSPYIRRLLVGLGNDFILWTGLKGPLTIYGIQLAIRRVSYRAGLTPPKAGPHVLRRTFGLHFIFRGADPFSLQAIMGHSNIQSTMIYVHMSNQHRSQQLALFSPLTEFDFS